MKNFHLYFFFLTLFLASCCPTIPTVEPIANIPLWKGKYAEGTVVAKAIGNELGFVELENGHDNSFLAIYDTSLFTVARRFEKIYVKVSLINNIPYVQSATRNPDPKEIISDVLIPETNIRFHSFDSDDIDLSIHKKMHLVQSGGMMASGSNAGLYLIQLKRDNDTLNFYGSGLMKYIADSLSGEVFVEYDDHSKVISDIDKCHYHFGEVFECVEED